MIIQFCEEYIDAAITLWNEQTKDPNWLYLNMDSDMFRFKFFPTKYTNTYLSILDNDVIGLSSGYYDDVRGVGYITIVLVTEDYQRQGYGSQLLKKVEEWLVEVHDTSTIEIVFWNPNSLQWQLPLSSRVIHPNAPGVLDICYANSWFQAKGYNRYAIQDVYYRSLKDFVPSRKASDKRVTLSAKNINITVYNESIHVGLSEFFDDMKNPSWEHAVLRGLTLDQPVLVVVHNDTVIGFTGPLYRESSGRGYFAGIGVHPTYRKQGIASVLFASLCDTLKQLGAEYMTLFTGRDNPARFIYLNEGFSVYTSFHNLRKKL